MAIEISLMSLGRFWCGDYVSPAMEAAWARGERYVAVDRRTRERRELGPGTPFGGADAAATRQRERAALRQKVDQLPGGQDDAWDENSGALRFCYPKDEAWQALLQDVDGHAARGVPLHTQRARIFLPVSFDQPCVLDNDTFGSLYRLQRELTQLAWTPRARPAVDLLLEAVREANMLRLPVIVARIG